MGLNRPIGMAKGSDSLGLNFKHPFRTEKAYIEGHEEIGLPEHQWNIIGLAPCKSKQ